MWPFKEPEVQLGFIHDPAQEADPRNLRYDEIAPMGAVDIPSFGDVEEHIRPLNQGRTSSCTCHSTVSAALQLSGVLLSPRHVFKEIKTNPEYPSSRLGWGAYMIDSVKYLIKHGIADYSLLPNAATSSDRAYLDVVITPEIREAAERFKGGSYVYVSSGGNDLENFDAIRRFMAEQGLPVKVGIDWRGSFNNARKTGIVPAAIPSGSVTGHDMLAVAWKNIDGHEYLGFRNSFGETWGDNGRVWLPKGFFKIRSAIALLPPLKTITVGIEMPAKQVTRNKYLEQAKALELQKVEYEKFPLNVEEKAKQANLIARGIAGRRWLVLVHAITYLGWSITDVINYLYAQSRGKTSNKAYSSDFTKHK